MKRTIRMLALISATLLPTSALTFIQTPVQYINNCDSEVVTVDNADYEYVEFDKNFLTQKLQARRASGINHAAIQQAQYLQREFGAIPKPTPLFTNKKINAFSSKLIGHEITIYMKDETVNSTGSFKDRMPIHFYQTISDIILHTRNSKQDLKVIAVSTGNHGRAVARAANLANEYIRHKGLKNKFNIYSEITMSTAALPHKKTAIAKLGALIRDHFPDPTLNENQWKPIKTYDEAENLVTHESKTDPDHTLLLLHADKYAINGYAVIAEEMIRQAQEIGINLAKTKPGEALMLAPLGSGGMLSGAAEISARFPNIYSIGVTGAPADMTYRSLKFCKLIRDTLPYKGELIIDGVMATPEPFSLKRIPEVAHEVVLVRQEDAVYAAALLKKNGINIEPTSGLPLAALLLGVNDHYKNARYAFTVLTGRNISSEMERKISTLAKQDEYRLLEYFMHRRSALLKTPPSNQN